MSEDIFIQTVPEDPLIAPVIEGLFGEYRDRYGDFFSSQPPEDDSVFSAPDGTFIVLLRNGAPIAMGAYKRYDEQTAELKRIWTHRALRRQGLAQKSCMNWNVVQPRTVTGGYFSPPDSASPKRSDCICPAVISRNSTPASIRRSIPGHRMTGACRLPKR